MTELDVLVVGSGGREYELARQMSLSPRVGKVYVAPGNSGTAALPKAQNVDLAPTDADGIAKYVQDNGIGAVIIGPDAAMAAGVADAVRAINCPVFGPNKNAARLEYSKAFATDFMSRHKIPHPQSWRTYSEAEALEIIQDRASDTYVLKADGLGAGKGVVLPDTTEEAQAALRAMFSGEGFEGAGKTGVVIQERLHGPEISAFAITDGKRLVMLPLTQDHKRLYDYDKGPNTGGMGAYTPVPSRIVPPAQADKIRAIAQRTINAMAEEGAPYQGVLYLGLMLAEEHGGEPIIIEYNARFGDPETQVLLPLLAASGVDVAELLLKTAQGDISDLVIPTQFTNSALTVALAAEGYPGTARKGDAIAGLDKTYPKVIVQHAGTSKTNDGFATAGGRVLYVTGFGDSADEAAKVAYGAIGPDGINFIGMQYRRDIGAQARSKN